MSSQDSNQPSSAFPCLAIQHEGISQNHSICASEARQGCGHEGVRKEGCEGKHYTHDPQSSRLFKKADGCIQTYGDENITLAYVASNIRRSIAIQQEEEDPCQGGQKRQSQLFADQAIGEIGSQEIEEQQNQVIDFLPATQEGIGKSKSGNLVVD